MKDLIYSGVKWWKRSEGVQISCGWDERFQVKPKSSSDLGLVLTRTWAQEEIFDFTNKNIKMVICDFSRNKSLVLISISSPQTGLSPAVPVLYIFVILQLLCVLVRPCSSRTAWCFCMQNVLLSGSAGSGSPASRSPGFHAGSEISWFAVCVRINSVSPPGCRGRCRPAAVPVQLHAL